jgi:YD repeat-containing protein
LRIDIEADFIASQKAGTETTTYKCDVLGNLRAVTLPSGTAITLWFARTESVLKCFLVGALRCSMSSEE